MRTVFILFISTIKEYDKIKTDKITFKIANMPDRGIEIN